MTDYVVTDTEAEALAIIEKYNSLLGLPTKDGRTLTYAIPRKHEKLEQWFFPIKDVVSHKTKVKLTKTQIFDELTVAEASKNKSDETLKAEEAFAEDDNSPKTIKT